MNIGEITADEARRETVELDPFSFFADTASVVDGLGGRTSAPDPTYAFHTPYAPAGRGPGSFTLRFTGLRATRGTLLVRVHLLPDAPGSVASLVNSQRVPLNWLAHNGGELKLSFEGYRGATFAAMGQVSDRTDAFADGLTVVLDRVDPAADAPGAAAADARGTSFGSGTVRPTSQLLSMDEPSFAEPVSQPCTAAQLADPRFAAWLPRLGAGNARAAQLWDDAYVLQVLERYGMARAGAQGLGFDEAPALVAPLLAERGAALTVARAGSGEGHDPDFPAAVREVRPDALPPDLVNFDFLWSRHVAERFPSAAAGGRFVERSLECLRPGGLAVHLLRLATPDAVRRADRTLWTRADIERLALSLIARRHEVARVKPGGRAGPLGGPAGASFGLIVRKARSAL